MNRLQENSIRQFNSWAKLYDRILFLPFYRANKYLIESLSPIPSSKLLDVGCGTGILLHQLFKKDKSLELFGIDISEEMVRVANRKFVNTSVFIQKNSVMNLPFENNYFDFVTCAFSFHHHPDSEASLREMSRVLKPGGKLALFDPFNDGIFRKIINKTLNLVFREGATNIYKKEEIYKMFQGVGLSHIGQKLYRFYELLTIGEKTIKR